MMVTPFRHQNKWELPGGYLDPGEEPEACAIREVEKETGWRPRSVKKLLTIQPMVGTIDQANIIYLARDADQTGTAVDINEAERISWIPLGEIQQRINSNAIMRAGSVAGLLAVLLAKATGQLYDLSCSAGV